LAFKVAIVARPAPRLAGPFTASLPVGPTHLETHDLGHAFGARVLFRRLALRVTPESPLAVTGANGAGKSTLARVLAGLLEPRRGTVRFVAAEREIPADTRPLHTGFVAPVLGLYDGLTVGEHLAFVAAARGARALHDRIPAVLDEVGLATRAHDAVGTLSTGLRQRVRLACALLPAPPLLVLDEPTANLDAEGTALVRRLCEAHTARGGLLVIATNDPAEAAWATQRVEVGEPGA
jgi:heme exporter protein A